MKKRLIPIGFLKNFSAGKLLNVVSKFTEKITICNMEDFIVRINKISEDKKNN